MGSREGVEGTGVGFWERFELMVVMLFSTRFLCPVNRGNLMIHLAVVNIHGVVAASFAKAPTQIGAKG